MAVFGTYFRVRLPTRKNIVFRVLSGRPVLEMFTKVCETGGWGSARQEGGDLQDRRVGISRTAGGEEGEWRSQRNMGRWCRNDKMGRGSVHGLVVHKGQNGERVGT